MNSQPLISCLCVTHDKPLLLQRAIDCFFNQNYKAKQMIILYEDVDCITKKYLASCHFPKEIKCIEAVSSIKKLSLGELRNLSISMAEGDYVCQWDDDDWYHPDRLVVQMAAMAAQHKPASILSRWTVFDAIHRKVYISNRRLWEGSILCKREEMLAKPYPSLNRGEDTSVIDYLAEKDWIEVIEDRPELYVYNYHGANTWDFAHFNKIFEYSKERTDEYARHVIECMSK